MIRFDKKKKNVGAVLTFLNVEEQWTQAQVASRRRGPDVHEAAAGATLAGRAVELAESTQ